MARYASKTTVSPDKSRAEIEKTLHRYGASAFMYGTSQNQAVVAFEMLNRRIKFTLPLPDIKSDEIQLDGRGWSRSESAIKAAYEQAVRQRWRALTLVIKAKLEAVESGVAQFEEEFLAHIVLPNGETVGRFMLPQVAKAYETNQMPPLLPGPS